MASTKSPRLSPVVLLLFAAFSAAAAPSVAGAACNQPPDLTAPALAARFDSNNGSIDTPFLIPGNYDLDQGTTAKKRTATIYNTAVISTDVVPVAFPEGTPKLVVLADNCSGVNLGSCGAVCEKTELAFQTGSVTFPVGDLVKSAKRTGPVRLASLAAGSDPCWLLNQGCGSAPPSSHACIDKLTPAAGTPANFDIGSVTLLPEPNDFSKLCKSSNAAKPCDQKDGDLEFTIDARGDILMPMYWGNLLKQKNDPQKKCSESGIDACEKRRVKATTSMPASSTGPQAIHIGCDESDTYLQSFNAIGMIFDAPPLFKADPMQTTDMPTTLLGTVDKAFSVLRIRQCPESDPTCSQKKFDIALEPAGNAKKIPHRTDGGGYCANSSTKCPDTACPAGVPCIAFDGEAGDDWQSGDPPFECTQGIGPKYDWWFWLIAALVVGGVAYLLLRPK